MQCANRERDVHIYDLHNWADNFHMLLKQTPLDSPKVKICAALFIAYSASLITLSTCLEPDERAYDDQLPSFKSIIEHSAAFLHADGPRNGNKGRGNIFSLEMSIVQPLYFTALKCRDWSVRHRALSLLRLCGKEGVWDGEIMAAIAQYIINHEESQVVALEMAKLEIPEYARVHGVGLNLDRASREVSIIFSKRRVLRLENAPKIALGQASEWVMDNDIVRW